MTQPLPSPITCLITSGATLSATTPADAEFRAVLALVGRAVDAGVTLVQLREKNLTARALSELAAGAARLARGSATRVLVNDRADVARAAGCDGVHLASDSLEASVVRRAFGPDFLVGVSAHSAAEARAARDGGADFALLGPVFDTPSKRAYGPPLGLDVFRAAARELSPFPVVALGGVTLENARACFAAGARGVAAIRLFADAPDLAAAVRAVEEFSSQ
ncbi:MAG TPA: thiamine phosphate synthase [Pyrinomonadaceae bacterium]|nr:thiamine phosphate synthase [Pyrinomonadaceae bacterium]